MALEDQIHEQYEKRRGIDALYNSVYSELADKERAAALKSLLSPLILPQHTILEVGSGQGNNVPMLRGCGFSEDRIFLNELLVDRVAAARKQYPMVHLYAGNALETNFDRTFDFVFQSTVFTSILDAADRQRLADKMWSLVTPGGYILWYDFIFSNPSNPDVRKVSFGELKRLFPDAVITAKQKITLAPPIGRRVGRLYPFFNLPFLRTHLLVLMQKFV
jgi:hypothetical protein